MPAAEIEMANSKKIQEKVWNAAEAATRLPDSHPSSGLLLLPAINNMIDIATTRTMALQIHPPRIIYALLFGLGLSVPCWLVSDVERPIPELAPYILGFTVLTVFIVYVMLDVQYPRAGLIRGSTAGESAREYKVIIEISARTRRRKDIPFSCGTGYHRRGTGSAWSVSTIVRC